MKYAAILKAENDWGVILVDRDGNPHQHEIKQWGMTLDGKLIPLNGDKQSLHRHNFLMLIDPNDVPLSWGEIIKKAKEMASTLTWKDNFLNRLT